MEENKISPIHSLTLDERKRITIIGVKKLDSFDKNEFLIETTLGFLHISGKELALGGMDMDKGHLVIDGKFDSLQYIDETNKKKEGFFKRLFK